MLKTKRFLRQNAKLQTRVSELEFQERQSRMLNSTLQTIRKVHQCIHREKDEDKLLLDTCRIIAENTPYQCVWIVKVSIDNKPVKIEQAGYGAEFQEFIEAWNNGKLPACIKTLLNGQKTMTINDPLVSCSLCPLQSHDSLHEITGLRLETNNHLLGILMVSHSRKVTPGAEEPSLLSELAGDISLALHALDLEHGQKHINQQLARSEQQFRTILTSASIGISLTRVDGSILEINTALAEMLGYTVGELYGGNFATFTHPEDVAASQKYLRSLFAGVKDKHEFDVRYLHKRGNVVWGHVNTILLRDSEGEPLHLITMVQDITDRKQAEEVFQKSEERYRLVLDHMIEGAQIIGRDLRFLYLNDAAAEHARRPKREILGHTLMEAYPCIENTEMFAVVRKCLAHGACHRMENEFIFPDGSRGWFELSMLPVPEGVATLSLDITARKQVETALRASEEMLRSILLSSPNAIAVTDLHGTIVECNQKMVNLLGYSSRDQLVGKDGSTFLSPKERKKAIITLKELLNVGSVETFARVLITKDEREFHAEISVNSIKDAQGKPVGFVSLIKDITERMRVEEALRKSQVSLLEAQKIAHVGSWEHDVKTGMEIWSNEMFRIFGRDPLTRGTSYTERRRAIHPEDWKKLDNALLNAIQTGTSIDQEMRMIHPDGTTRWGRMIGQSLKNEVGQVITLRGTLQDITDHKQAEKALRESEEKFRSIMVSSPNAITVTDLNGTIVECNQKALYLLGFPSSADMIGKNWLVFITPNDRERALECMKNTLERGFIENIECMLVTKDGREFPGELSASVINNSDDKPVRFVAITKDITKRKRAEEELRFRNVLLSTQQETTIDGILAVDEKGIILSCNQRFIDMWVIPSDVIKTRSDQLVLKVMLEKIVDPDQFSERVEHLSANRCVIGQDEIFLKDGRIFEQYSAPMQESNARYYGRVWYFRDITERKQAEGALRESEQKFRNFIEQSAEILLLTDEGGKLILWNHAAEQLFGLKGSEAQGKYIWDIQFKFVIDLKKNLQYLQALKRNTLHVLVTGQGSWVNQIREMEIRLPTGEHAILETRAFSIQTEKGFLIGSVNRDVTKSRRSEELLKKRLMYERMLAEISGQALLISNTEDFFQKILEILGKTLDITRVSLYRYYPDAGAVSLLREWVDSRYTSAEYHLREISPSESQWIAEQLASNQVKLFVDSDKNLAGVHVTIPPAPNSKKRLVVPLSVDQECFGFLGFEDAQHDRVWRDEDIDILRTTATIIAQTISRNKYKEQLEEIVLNRTKQLQTTVEQLEKVIRERQSVQEELLDAKIAAETANRAKSEFLANMSHELRTPLNAITGFSQILQDSIIAPVNREQQEVLGNILESGNHLLTLINEILDLSKIEAGKVELKWSSFHLAPFLERCQHLFSDKAAAKNLVLSMDVSKDIDYIVADEVKLKQVVFNLLSNAVKYTLTGGDVGIQARIVGDQIQITVWDTGIGLSQGSIPKLFQPFGRIVTEYSKGFGGTGLGLHYSKKLVELHGGTIWVESEEGKGSRFHFTIPHSNPHSTTPNMVRDTKS